MEDPFNHSHLGSHRMGAVLKTLHGFTEKVIAERKQELNEKLKVVKHEEQEEVNKMIMMRIFVDMISL